jgi:hypothetical protein
MVQVVSSYGRKAIQMDGSPTDLLAEQLFRQIVRETTLAAARKK